MLYAYGATVVEIVRRKEFARFFYGRAQSVLEVMAKLSCVYCPLFVAEELK
jgi:autophagy-related protein 11